MTLDEMNPGSEGRIKHLSVRDKLGQRLVDMGVYPLAKLPKSMSPVAVIKRPIPLPGHVCSCLKA